MTLSRRLIITVAASVGVAIIGVALAMGLLARDALIEQAEDQARLVAGLIASEANRAEHTADEIDRMIVGQMEAQALAIARRLDNHAHEAEDERALGIYFAKLTADSSVDDVWLLDEAGTPLVRAVEGLSQSDAPDLASAGIDPRVVEALVSGRRFSVAFQSMPPNGWEKPIRYVGVRTGTREAVLVGTLAADTGGPGEVIGIDAALDSLAGREAVQAIWVVNDLLHLIGMATFGAETPPKPGRRCRRRTRTLPLALSASTAPSRISASMPSMWQRRSSIAAGSPRAPLSSICSETIWISCSRTTSSTD